MAGRIIGRLFLALLLLVVLLAAVVAGIDTGPGHSLAVRIVAGLKPADGLRYTIGRIDGSLYGRLTARDVVVRDGSGVVATIPAVTIEWHPGSLLRNRVAADLVEADLATVLRKPVLLPTPPSPLLPDIDIEVGKLVVRRLVLEAPVTGTRQVIGISGDADIASGRARINADVGATGGDRLTVKLDAVPDADRFIVDAHLAAPAGGVVDGLAKLGKPLSVDVAGNGTWRDWHGRADATLGSARLADLTLTATGGRFVVTGTARPGLIAPAAAKLTDPAAAIKATAAVANRVVDADVRLVSPALDIAVRGKVDLGAGRYEGVRIDARLLRPGAVLDQVRGRDVTAALTVDGPFATPTIDYRIAAAALGFGTTGVENLRAAGIATVDATRVMLPVHATATRVTGIDAASGGLLRNVRIDGDLRITSSEIASDNLRLRSDQIDATVVLAAELATGEYTAAIKGRVNRYALAGVGIVDLVTDAKLVPAGKGTFRVSGNVRATTLRIDNPSVRDFLGGNAVVTAAIARAPEGLVSVASLRVTAPRFRITDGGGSYRSDGRIAFTASGVQRDYGLLSVAVSGTVAKPVAVLRAKRPNVGVQLNDVEAVLRPAANGYSVTAKGGSPYGPFAVDVGLQVAGPLTIDIHRASLAGLIVTGRVAATKAGPYAGSLALTGPGLTGSVQLAAAGTVQRADVRLLAANARIPLPQPVVIAQGTASLQALLYPNAPQLSGSATFAGVQQDTLKVARLKAAGEYRAGSGHLDLTADGESGVPFAIAANVGFAPSAIRVNGSGTIDTVALRLAAPAEVRIGGGKYQLLPTTILLPNGSVVVSGNRGTTTSIDARLQAVDLALAEAFSPGLGIAGKVSGSVAATLPAGTGFPTAHADLIVSGFSRAGLTTTSTPVDLALTAQLSQAGADARAVLRRGTVVLGRAQARLTPIPGTDAQPWTERLLAAPLGGGIRFNGPAEQLWALAGVSGQQLSGPLAIGADFGGHVGAPQIRGLIRGKGLRYENTAFGTVVDQIALDSRFIDTRLEITSLSGRTVDNGSLSATGYADLAADKGFPIAVDVKLAKAHLARSRSIDATVSGTLAISNSTSAGALLSGDLVLNRTRYTILRPAAAEVVELEGVRRKNAAPVVAAPTAGPPSDWKLAINLRADNEIFVEGMGLEAEWRAALKISGTADQPVVVGPVTLVRGTYAFGGRSFALTRGILTFAGETPVNPTLDIEATTSVTGLTAIIDITGRAFAPVINFTSTPVLAQDEVLSRLLFGGSVESLTPTQALQLAASLNTLRGSSGGGFNPLGTLRKATGIDRLRVLGADTATGAGPSVAAGKYISNRIYVEVTTDARGYTSTQIEIAISRTLRLLSAVSSFGGSNVSVRYSRDY